MQLAVLRTVTMEAGVHARARVGEMYGPQDGAASWCRMWNEKKVTGCFVLVAWRTFKGVCVAGTEEGACGGLA
eukprot:5572884-Prorocentrum_lima.AAC.1